MLDFVAAQQVTPELNVERNKKKDDPLGSN